MARSQLRYPDNQYFGFQNPLNNPNMTTYFADGYQVAGLGNLPGGPDPDKSAAQPGTGPIGNQTGQDYDFLEEGTQGSGDPSGPAGPVEKETNEETNEETFDKDGDGELSEFERLLKVTREMQEYATSPERHQELLKIYEPYHHRVAQRKHRMGLANIEAAGKAAFNYKYAPQMFMTAAASRAAYYPEMVRAASESFTGLNLANAAKPRMSGYFRGIV